MQKIPRFLTGLTGSAEHLRVKPRVKSFERRWRRSAGAIGPATGMTPWRQDVSARFPQDEDLAGLLREIEQISRGVELLIKRLAVYGYLKDISFSEEVVTITGGEVAGFRFGLVMAAGDLRKTLTERELEVARMVAAGLRNRDISVRLGISLNTAGNYVRRLLRKLNVRSRAGIARCFSAFEATRATPVDLRSLVGALSTSEADATRYSK